MCLIVTLWSAKAVSCTVFLFVCPPGAPNSEGVKKFVTLFLVHRLTKCVEVWHDDGIGV